MTTKKSMWMLAMVLLAAAMVFSVIGCGDDDDSDGDYSAVDYAPLAVGWQWIYEEIDTVLGEITVFHTVTSTRTLAGKTMYLTTTTTNDTTYSYFEDGAYYVYTPDMGEHILALPKTFGKGDSWTAMDIDTTYSEEGYTVHMIMHSSCSIVGTENITVPAGSFSCIKLRTITNTTTDIGIFNYTGSDTTFSWLAKNIGLVKQGIDGEDGSQVLTAYTRP